MTVWPNGSRFRPYISSFFGYRPSPGGIGTRNHKGIDIPLAKGAPLVSPQNGVVTVARYLGGWGNHVEVRHAGGYSSTASHMLAIEVKVGQNVKEGQVIGHVGMTGNTTGPHVHSEIKLHAVDYIDPLPWYTSRVSPTQQSGGSSGGGITAPPIPEEEPMNKHIRDTDGGHFVFDEFGAENIGGMKDPGVSTSEIIAAANLIYGPYEQVSVRARQVAVSLQRRKGEKNRAAIAAAIPKTTVATATVDKKSIVTAVAEAFRSITFVAK